MHRDEKGKKYTTELVEHMPEISTIPYTTYIGSFSWFCPKLKTRWLLVYDAYNYGAGWVSPSDIARDFVAVRFPNGSRTTREQRVELSKKRSQPLFAIRSDPSDAVYMDIAAAYWTITRIVSVDVDYYPEKWLSVKSDVEDFPFWWHKLARNCIVTVGLNNPITIWNGAYIESKNKGNSRETLGLWAVVQDTLRGIASDMVRAGAIYVNTDGYILARKAIPVAEEIAESWGVSLREKFASVVRVHGVGAYDLPERESPIEFKDKLKDYSNIDLTKEWGWLRKRIKAFADNRPEFYEEK